MVCTSRFATAILSGETELALGTIRVKRMRMFLKKENSFLNIMMEIPYF